MKNQALRLFVSLFALGFIACTGVAQTAAGVIKAARITGAVSRVDAAGVQSPLADGATLAETDTVVTGADSGLVLVFMNGSSVKLGANSRLLIEEFKMDPLDRDIAVATLKNEPTKSKTSLNLAYGELVGDVKKLNKSSTYNIKTPVGAAGIRGTQFRIVLTPSADGKSYTFSLGTAEGLVVFTVPAGGAPAEVGRGTEVVLVADIDTTTGKVTTAKVQTQGISTENAAQIETAVTTSIEQAKQGTVFTPTEQTSGGSTGGSTGGNSGGDTAGAQGNSNTGTTGSTGSSGSPIVTGTSTPANVSPR